MTGAFDDALIDRSRRLGAATLHEAAGRIGSLPPTIKPVDPSWRIAGPACTVPSAAGDNLALHRAIVAAEPGTVIVAATGDTGPGWGYWGEIMSTAAQVAELEGLVLQGGSRDHAALPDIGFPVFSLGACIRGTSKRPAPERDRINDPIEIGEVTIHSGDLIVGDIDGVVAIPAADAGEALAAGIERVATEATMLQQVRAGETTLDIFGLS